MALYEQQVDPAGAVHADGFLRSTSAMTRGSIRTRVFVKWVESSTWWLRCGQSMPILSRAFAINLCWIPYQIWCFSLRAHCYMWRGDWVLHNVSEVVSHDMSPFAKDAMEKHRHGPDGWELRGRVLHRVLQASLRTSLLCMKTAGIRGLNRCWPILCSRALRRWPRSICWLTAIGRLLAACDFVIRHKDDPTFVILGDLKTVSSKKAVSSRKFTAGPALAPMRACGCNCFPKVRITECVTVISGPEKCKVRRHSPEDDCIPPGALGKQALQPVADFCWSNSRLSKRPNSLVQRLFSMIVSAPTGGQARAASRPPHQRGIRLQVARLTCPRPLSKDEKPDTKGKSEGWWTGQNPETRRRA